MKQPTSRPLLLRHSQGVPDAKAMDALRAASEAARKTVYKQGAR